MRLYHPRLSVKIVKAFKRSEIAPGMPVVQRRYQALDAIDLTPYIGDSGNVTVTKSVRQPTGGFSISFPDQMHKELEESLYALIEPMDLVEIRMAHGDGEMPIMMRGFVSSVDRDETMIGQNPSRIVTVSGQDFAKILQIIQIHYHAFTQAAQAILSEFRFFQAYASASDVKIKLAGEFVSDLLSGVINPYMKNITSLSSGKSVGAKVINAWSSSVGIDGAISPSTMNWFVDVSLYDVMRTCLDVGVFNEMYLEDTEDGASLIVRPIPFKTIKGKFIQGIADELSVVSEDIKSFRVNRSDHGVANYYWVGNHEWQLMLDQDLRSMAYMGDPGSFILSDYKNASQSFFGFRKMEAHSMLGDDKYAYSNAASSQSLPDQTTLTAGWLEKRRNLLIEMNKDNLVFESGVIQVRGNELIKPGSYLKVYRGNRVYVGECYAHTVTHQFIPFHGYVTSVQFDRGTFFIERSRNPSSPYIPEIERGVQ